ncbi:ABC transporter substrate-binding protein [Seleniivibrio sp.]|uniref:ABC transporter substrate-binding protein n=1 Tax=Seleniivibrio sp. TaxID=2898801 RepID=UPI0025ED0C89|nr:ABC transporter substrate-binding protein [Seleniivibrio sp.]MCD8553405.1 ABC transporter substrate-binding protein [Seleniivibrio sp.]
MYRYFLISFISTALFLAGCSKETDRTTVGFMNTLSGRYSEMGQDTIKGVMLALSDSGMEDKINLDIQDDSGIPAEGVAALSRLSDKGVKYVIGPGLSNIAQATVPLLKSRGMYMLSPTVSTSELAGKHDNFVRIIPHNSKKQAQQITKYIVHKLNVRNTVILYDNRNSPYSTDIVRSVTSSFMEQGCNVKDIRAFNPESGESMHRLIEKDRQNPPDMYYIVGSPLDTALIIWQIKKADYSSKIAIRAWAAGNEFMRFGGKAVEGVYLFDYYVDKKSNEYSEFRKRYMARFKEEPSWMSVNGYETGQIMFHSLKDVKNGKKFCESIIQNAGEISLLKGLKIDSFGDAQLPLSAFIIKNGIVEKLEGTE